MPYTTEQIREAARLADVDENPMSDIDWGRLAIGLRTVFADSYLDREEALAHLRLFDEAVRVMQNGNPSEMEAFFRAGEPIELVDAAA